MVGSRIRELRTEKHMSLSDLAKRADVVKSYLSTIERGITSNPTIEVVKKIAKALLVDPEVLLEFEKPNQEDPIASNPYFHVRKLFKEMDDEQLKELKDYIDFILWKRQQNE